MPIHLPTILDVMRSAHRIRPYVRRTPLEPAHHLSKMDLFFKMESWQRTGSFKLRGAINRLLLLSASEQKVGVLTASAGNHGLGVALAAEILGIPATIVVPENASETKIAALQRYPVTLIKHGLDYDEAEQHARQLAADRHQMFLHAFNDPQVIAGQGTVGWEIVQEAPQIAAVVVPVGGGGLIGGVALAMKSIHPGIEVIGVQPEASPAMVRALEEGRVVETPILPTLADGLAGRFVSELTLSLCQRYVDRVITVSESSIREAMLHLMRNAHVLAEPSAAVSIAAVLEGGVVPGRGVTVLVITGRNVSHSVVEDLM